VAEKSAAHNAEQSGENLQASAAAAQRAVPPVGHAQSATAGCVDRPFPMARYLLENRSGVVLEAEQVGCNTPFALHPHGASGADADVDADGQLHVPLRPFSWMDTHVESEAFLHRHVVGGAGSSTTDFAAAMLPFLRQERAVHMRGRGAFLWSAPFDIDTPGMRPLKISVDARASLCVGPLRDMYQVRTRSELESIIGTNNCQSL
jgi:hypothetical protein